MIVNDAFVTLVYDVEYSSLMFDDVIRAEKFLTRTLFKSFRPRQRAIWRDLQLEVDSFSLVSLAAKAMLKTMKIRCDMDGGDLPAGSQPIPELGAGSPTVTYLFVSPVEHRVIYIFPTGYRDASNNYTEWKHQFRATGGGYALGTVKTIVSWAKPAESDPADFDGQFELREVMPPKPAPAHPFHHPLGGQQ